jgi:hypothetical protein
MRVIVPCAGSSSRFPDMPPKWMLPDHDGVPMVVRAVAGLNLPLDRFVFTILREHVVKYDALAGLQSAFGGTVDCVILDYPTRSQSETVAETIKRHGITGPVMVKDSDNHFAIDHLEESYNYVSVASLHDFDLINARNKSYTLVDQDGILVNIREKQVISDLFSVGGYYFQDAEDFVATYDELQGPARAGSGELYISEIIAYMVLNGASFRVKKVERYEDWGTIHEWRKELERRRVFLVSIDGFLFERGSNHFAPRFADVSANESAVQAVRAMRDTQQTVIYLSVRPPQLESLTRTQLQAQGLPDGPIIFGCGVAQWSLVTAGHATLPFITAQAHEVDPRDINMLEKLDLIR